MKGQCQGTWRLSGYSATQKSTNFDTRGNLFRNPRNTNKQMLFFRQTEGFRTFHEKKNERES